MIYELEIICSDEQWWRYNLFMTLIGYDQAGVRTGFSGHTERQYDVWSPLPRRSPEGWTPGRGSVVRCGPCHHAAGYIYAIANTLPDSARVTDSPDFYATVIARGDGREILRKEYPVNPWGGLALAGIELDVNVE